ncbi:MAG: FAD-dependent oxidoreductase [Desulfobacteraceae bacterium]|jgi:2,4-dienoyl-CoA reductase-like NADH-dependent reductase (Old Yellow Enzyme family)/thioredoxin reductase
MVLFEPVRLGPVELKNRLVMTAMSTRLAGPKGQVTERLIKYYVSRAEGGVGLITVEEASIHPQLPHIEHALGVYEDDLIQDLRRLSQRIHEGGASVSLQIGLYFRQHVTGYARYVASVKAPGAGPESRELTPDEIHFLTGLFAQAARRAREAGFDAVEVHACHGCIVSEFLSPYWNRRTDAYGRDRSGRFRFPLEILTAIREKVGSDFPVIFRVSGSEFHDRGFTPQDGIAFSEALEEGGVTAINVSGGLGHINHIAIPPSHVPRGVLLPLARGIKEAVSVPVIVGNSLTPELAIQAVESRQTDLVGLGRPLIADPEWPLKVQQGRLEEIRSCIRCNQGCLGGLRDQKIGRVTCIYNPQAGYELERPIIPSKNRRRVVVVGGGPAGCEVARVARLRGHEVILFEEKNRLGGQFNLAAAAVHRRDFLKLPEFYANLLSRIGVDARLGIRATSELLESFKAEVYVLATGSVPIRPGIPGVELDHVTDAHGILDGTITLSDRDPVVVIGGGATGLETADFMSEKGMQVIVVEMLDSPGRDMTLGIGVRENLLDRLAGRKVRILTGHRALAIHRDAVVVSDRPLVGGGNEFKIPARRVVLAVGTKPDLGIGPSDGANQGVWYRVGDCESVGNAMDAIHAAFELARQI